MNYYATLFLYIKNKNFTVFLEEDIKELKMKAKDVKINMKVSDVSDFLIILIW